jgi:hypothetical protein
MRATAHRRGGEEGDSEERGEICAERRRRRRRRGFVDEGREGREEKRHKVGAEDQACSADFFSPIYLSGCLTTRIKNRSLVPVGNSNRD